jgi:hypothetical protein
MASQTGVRGEIITAANVDSNSFDAPAANADAECSFTATPDLAWHISQIFVSYDVAPTNGAIKVEVYNAADDAVESTPINHPITSEGLGPIEFSPPMRFTPGRRVVVTLAAGGSGITGKLFINKWLGA